MITKRQLLAAICDLNNDVYALTLRLAALEDKVEGKPKVKRGPGRPKKNK